jgi:hypothetical protein
MEGLLIIPNIDEYGNRLIINGMGWLTAIVRW